jgi:hypothetical protein
MNIKYLKAGSGDAILIQDGTYNILIDGGNDFTYVRDEVTKIFNAGQKLDLVIVTHHDDDHIAGIISLLRAAIGGDFGEEFIKEILFNSPRKIRGLIPSADHNTLSYRQAQDLENLLVSYTAKWDIATADNPARTFGAITLRFLSPVKEVLETYSSAEGAYLTSDYRCDWDSSMASLERYLDDKSQDDSESNKTSVVILAETPEKKVLLTGDCVPERMEEILLKLQEENPGNPVHFDYVKLPHHGSYRSLSRAILSKIDCSKFIISTNSKKYYLPNKRAILKVAKFVHQQKDDIEFLFNYAEPIEKLNIKPNELRKYRIKLTLNNEIYGYGT